LRHQGVLLQHASKKAAESNSSGPRPAMPVMLVTASVDGSPSDRVLIAVRFGVVEAR
jgi:hypothetical protein